MGLFNKKEKWWDKKSVENNPLKDKGDTFRYAMEEHNEKEAREKLRQLNEQQMNKQMYGQTTTPNGLYQTITSAGGSGGGGGGGGLVYNGSGWNTMSIYSPETLRMTAPYIDFFKKILATRPDIVI